MFSGAALVPSAGEHAEKIKLTAVEWRPRSPHSTISKGDAMKLPHRRKFLHLAAGAAALPVVSRVARAQAYPTRPVRIIVGFPAGGSGDFHARLMGQWLSERLGQQFVVENRPGAGGKAADDAHRSRRIRLRPRHVRCER